MRICVIFGLAWMHKEARVRSTPPHLGRSVSRLPNSLNSRTGVAILAPASPTRIVVEYRRVIHARISRAAKVSG